MGQRTKIGWTDHTFNIAWGCMKVSPGCANCYAATFAKRIGLDIWGPAKTTARRTMSETYWRQPLKWNRDAERDGVRRRVFCSSMADVFEDHPTIDTERAKLWPLSRATPWLDWQLLTKRPERIAANLPDDWGRGYPNVWLGTSVESQEYADIRIPHLLAVPAVVRFLSCEPLLGPVDLRRINEYGAGDSWDALSGYRTSYGSKARSPSEGSINVWSRQEAAIQWVIVGGESGAGARPMELAWAAALRDQCASARVAFYLKQLGGVRDKRADERAWLDGHTYTEMPR